MFKVVLARQNGAYDPAIFLSSFGPDSPPLDT